MNQPPGSPPLSILSFKGGLHGRTMGKFFSAINKLKQTLSELLYEKKKSLTPLQSEWPEHHWNLADHNIIMAIHTNLFIITCFFDTTWFKDENLNTYRVQCI